MVPGMRDLVTKVRLETPNGAKKIETRFDRDVQDHDWFSLAL